LAIRKIRLKGDSILKKKSRPVEKFDERLHQLIDDMIQTMKEENGIGIAAPQVGILRRIVVVKVEEDVHELVNPVITKTCGEQEVTEGCLSFPGRYGITKRPKEVLVEAKDRNDKKIALSGEGLLSAIICHEIDHLEGILFESRIVKEIEQEFLDKN
jgi:peptide deformylase